jgi:hypothetical protein
MIWFNFVVSDEEAENIFNALSDQINSIKSHLMEEQLGKDCNEARSEWYRRHIEHLEALKSKMKNTYISA